MFKISYRDLRSDPFKQTMQKIALCGAYPEKVAYNIMRMTKALEAELKKSNEEWVKLAKSLIQIDEKGMLKFNEEKTDFLWLDGIPPAEGKAKIEEFGAKEVIIDRRKLKLSVLAPAKLSPADLANIECLLDGEETVE